jgi:hypothetical protein
MFYKFQKYVYVHYDIKFALYFLYYYSKIDIDIYNIYLLRTSLGNMSEQEDVLISEVKVKGIEWIENVLQKDLTMTKPGSISHLLYGDKPSEQSINIKLGRFGEFLAKELIKSNDRFDLLDCGVQKINNKNKDVDLIFIDKRRKVIYYREMKGNIELDTEKLPATIAKCNDIRTFFTNKYGDCDINCAILNWSIYDRQNLTAGLSNIKTFEKADLKIEHMEEFFEILGATWSKEDYYSYFRMIGSKIITRFVR